MAPEQRVIIDTDPGIDDILALLLAFASSPEELEVPLVSVTHGNVDVQSCLRNVVSLFHIIEKEQKWRIARGQRPGFEMLGACKPVVAVGAEEPLEDQLIMADFFHGRDGLGGIHTTHPHLTPSDTWRTMFQSPTMGTSPSDTLKMAEVEKASQEHHLFTPSSVPAHLEMLRILAESPPDTVTIVAVGPLTNLALAAAADTETFLRAKEVVVMGGAINVPGNITPLAEFNTHADAVAAARVYALTSLDTVTTMPLVPPPQPARKASLAPYPLSPARLPLNLVIFPLDITVPHRLQHDMFTSITAPLLAEGSPMAQWVDAFMTDMWNRAHSEGATGLGMHDPLCVWYAIANPTPAAEGAPTNRSIEAKSSATLSTNWKIEIGKDIRVETIGQWSRGACITDRRGVAKLDEEKSGDRQKWLYKGKGNMLKQAIGSPPDVQGEGLAKILLTRVFDASA